MNRTYDVAIAGATGVVGDMVRRVLEERSFPVRSLRLLASAASVGMRFPFGGQELAVEDLGCSDLHGVDFVFSCVGSPISRDFTPGAVSAGAVVIDKSDAFRMDPRVPLVVPEVNGEDLLKHEGVVASPNCSAIPLAMVLKSLCELAPLRRVVVSTYQSVSGAGREAEDRLEREAEDLIRRGRPSFGGSTADLGEGVPRSFAVPIAFNLIPYIGVPGEDGSTDEETKMVRETRKILHLPFLPLAATAVRVPVFVGHSESINVEFEGRVTPEAARQVLSRAPGLVVRDDRASLSFPTPREAAGKNDVFVGRIREDPSVESGLSLWVVTDNLRKGAATNAVQIAERLIGA